MSPVGRFQAELGHLGARGQPLGAHLVGKADHPRQLARLGQPRHKGARPRRAHQKPLGHQPFQRLAHRHAGDAVLFCQLLFRRDAAALFVAAVRDLRQQVSLDLFVAWERSGHGCASFGREMYLHL